MLTVEGTHDPNWTQELPWDAWLVWNSRQIPEQQAASCAGPSRATSLWLRLIMVAGADVSKEGRRH